MNIEVIDKIKPKNNGTFPVVDAVDVAVTDRLRLSDALTSKAEASELAQTNEALAASTANLQGQIDQIVVSASAEAVVAPEVVAARVSEDGTEYTTLKDRLDGVDEINQSNFEKIADVSDNLYDSTTALEHTKLDGVGRIGTAQSCFTSDYIPVIEGMKYYKSIDNSSPYNRVCGYDATNIWSGFVTTDQNFVIPTGTHFIRVTGQMPEIDTAVVRSTTANDVESRRGVSQAYDYTRKVESSIFTTNDFIKASKIIGITKKSGMNAYTRSGYIEIEDLANFDSYYFIADREYSLWIDEVESSYFAILYGTEYTSIDESGTTVVINCSGTIARLRSTNNNLPTEDNKLTIPRGTALVFVVPHGEDQSIYGIKGDYELTDDFVSKTSAVAVGSLTNSGQKICTETSAYTETYDSQYADASGMHTLSTYISFGLLIPQNTELYTESRNNDYFSICVYDDTNFTNGVRYRAFGSEDTLPYVDSPLTLVKGQYVVFTVKKDNKEFEVALPNIEEIISFRNDIPLAETHVDQVLNSIPNRTKDCFIKYVGLSGESYSTERVDVYIPTGVGYIDYEFVHSVRQEVNSNVWRMAFAYACDKDFERRYTLTTSGEWECAVHLEGRTDFSGGVIHGDEVLTGDAIFFVDGAIVDITKYNKLTAFTNFAVVESTELYDPNDSTTIIAHHGSEHIFNKDGLKINQSLLWVAAQNLTSCYLAMHLPAKAVTDHMYTDNSIIPFEITTYGISFPESKRAIVYGEDSGVRTEFSIGAYPVMANGNRLFMTDNNGGAYNKCYFVVTTDAVIEANTLWKTETYYKFDVNL